MMPDTNIQSPSWRELARENSRLKDELSRLREEHKAFELLPDDIQLLVARAEAWEPHTTRRNLAAMKLGMIADRLREVIKGAPHHIECALTYRGPNGELSYCDEDISLCDCWKRDALKEEK